MAAARLTAFLARTAFPPAPAPPKARICSLCGLQPLLDLRLPPEQRRHFPAALGEQGFELLDRQALAEGRIGHGVSSCKPLVERNVRGSPRVHNLYCERITPLRRSPPCRDRAR